MRVSTPAGPMRTEEIQEEIAAHFNNGTYSKEQVRQSFINFFPGLSKDEEWLRDRVNEICE